MLKRTTVASLASPPKAGWLMKQGHFFKNWKKRWFVLKDKKLFYFANQTATSPKGVVLLDDYYIDVIDDPVLMKKAKRDKDEGIVMFSLIHTIKPDYTIVAESEDEMKDWIQNILLEMYREKTVQVVMPEISPGEALEAPSRTGSRIGVTFHEVRRSEQYQLSDLPPEIFLPQLEEVPEPPPRGVNRKSVLKPLPDLPPKSSSPAALVSKSSVPSGLSTDSSSLSSTPSSSPGSSPFTTPKSTPGSTPSTTPSSTPSSPPTLSAPSSKRTDVSVSPTNTKFNTGVDDKLCPRCKNKVGAAAKYCGKCGEQQTPSGTPSQASSRSSTIPTAAAKEKEAESRKTLYSPATAKTLTSEEMALKRAEERRLKSEEEKKKKEDEAKQREAQFRKEKEEEQQRAKEELEKKKDQKSIDFRKKEEEEKKQKQQDEDRKKREADEKKRREEREEEERKRRDLEKKKREDEEKKRREEEEERKRRATAADLEKRRGEEERKKREEEDKKKREAEEKKKRDEEEKKRREEEERKRKAVEEEDRRRRATEADFDKKKREEDRIKREAEDKKRREEDEKKELVRRQTIAAEDERKQKEAEERKRVEEERKRKGEEEERKKKVAEEERKRREEEERKKKEKEEEERKKRVLAEEEKKKKEEEERKKKTLEDEKKRKEEEERRRKQAEDDKKKKDEEEKKKREAEAQAAIDKVAGGQSFQMKNNNPPCAKCNKPLSGTTMQALGKEYHTNCFDCGNCSKVIAGRFAVIGNKTMCEPCAMESVKNKKAAAGGSAIGGSQPSRTAPGSSSTAKKCFKCQQPLSGAVIQAIGQEFHERCFGCFDCGKKLTASCLNVGGKALCDQCGKKNFISAQKQTKEHQQQETKSGMTGLLQWCKNRTAGYNGVEVRDFIKSWQDGLAYCALLHSYRPDLINFDSLKKENKDHNINLAFDVARKLNIEQLLDPEDFAIEKLSMMTYLSQAYLTLKKLE